jgi:hypothetical protein
VFFLLASLTKNSRLPKTSTPTPRGRAQSAAPTLPRSESVRCAWKFATALTTTVNTRIVTKPPLPSPTNKVLCPRIFVRGSKGRTRRAGM